MFKFDIDGFEKAVKDMEKISEQAVYEAQFQMVKDAEYITHSVKQITPVDTGKLKKSYNYKIVKDSKDHTEIVIDTDTEYAPHVEFGTYRQKAQPHFTPVVNSHLPKIPKNVLQAIKKVVEK